MGNKRDKNRRKSSSSLQFHQHKMGNMLNITLEMKHKPKDLKILFSSTTVTNDSDSVDMDDVF